MQKSIFINSQKKCYFVHFIEQYFWKKFILIKPMQKTQYEKTDF